MFGRKTGIGMVNPPLSTGARPKEDKMKRVTTRETFVQCPHCKGLGSVLRRWTEGGCDATGRYVNSGFDTVKCSLCNGTKECLSHREVITEKEK